MNKISLPQINKHLREKARKKTFIVPPVEGCVTPGSSVKLPLLRPCIHLHWGNSERDEIETNDEEIFCIVASNPYTNVIFKDLTIITVVTKLDGKAVPVLPDGTPSVEITPSNVIYFGNLPSLDPSSLPSHPPPASKPGAAHRPACKTPAPPLDPTSVAREVVLISRGAKPSEYVLQLEYTFSIEYACPGTNDFKLELVAS